MELPSSANSRNSLFSSLLSRSSSQYVSLRLMFVMNALTRLFQLIVFAANNFDTDREIVLYAVATGLSMIPASLVVSPLRLIGA